MIRATSKSVLFVSEASSATDRVPSTSSSRFHSIGLREISNVPSPGAVAILKTISMEGTFFLMRFHSSSRLLPSMITFSMDTVRPMSSSTTSGSTSKSKSPWSHRIKSKMVSCICSCTKASSTLSVM